MCDLYILSFVIALALGISHVLAPFYESAAVHRHFLTLQTAFQSSSRHAFSQKYVESKRAGRTLVAIILGLNVKQAASQGMIDSSLLPSRAGLLQPAVTRIAEEDDSLFVSEDENETPAPKIQINGHTQDFAPFAASSASASTSSNVFQGFSQTATSESSSNLEINKPAGPFAQPAPQPVESKQTFSSLFAASQKQGPTTTTVTTPNPFAFSFPATSTSQISAASQSQNGVSNAQQAPGLFLAKSSVSTSETRDTAVSTSPFQFKPPDSTNLPPATSAQPFSFTAPAPRPFSLPAGDGSVSVSDSTKTTQAPSSSILNFPDKTPSLAETKAESGPSLFSHPVQKPDAFQKPPSLFNTSGPSFPETEGIYPLSVNLCHYPLGSLMLI